MRKNVNQTSINHESDAASIASAAAEYVQGLAASKSYAQGEIPWEKIQKLREERLRCTRKLLSSYRWASRCVQVYFESESLVEDTWGSRLKILMANAEMLGVEVRDIELKGQKQAMELSQHLLNLIDLALQSVKSDPDDGARLHRILEVTYFRTPSPGSKEMILQVLAQEGDYLSRSAYYYNLRKAERSIDVALWDFMSSESRELLRSGLNGGWAQRPW